MSYMEESRVSLFFFFSSRRRHTRCYRDWSSDVCSSDLGLAQVFPRLGLAHSNRAEEILAPEHRDRDEKVGKRVPHALDLRSALGAFHPLAVLLAEPFGDV